MHGPSIMPKTLTSLIERTTRAVPLEIVRSESTDLERYARWNACRQEVFGVEMGWRLVQDADAAPWQEVNDAHATFFSAEKQSQIIGIVRNLRTEFAFPHRELFEAHLLATGLDRALGIVGTVNALAVVPGERRRLFATKTGHRGTAAALLLASSLEDFERDGTRVVLATVLSMVSARTFMRAGFRLLDLPAPSPNDPRFILANIGKVLDVAHTNALVSRTTDLKIVESVRAYFEQREQSVLAKGRLMHLFGPANAA
jgi:N-acyl-L-homoserine lactone synthetase